MSIKSVLGKLTGKKWTITNGPETGVGVEYYFKSGKSEAYVCEDQGFLSISVDGDLIFSGYEDEIED